MEKDVCTAFGIRGYPTIKVIHNGTVYDYRGGRSEDEFIADATGAYVHNPSVPLPKEYQQDTEE